MMKMQAAEINRDETAGHAADDADVSLGSNVPATDNRREPREQSLNMDRDDFELQNLSPAGDPEQKQGEPRRAIKFTYPGGARPLTGYTIKRGIGRGGFGEVYFAHSDAGKEVALKLIRRNFEVELRGVKQCLNLKHSNLVAIHDIRTDDTDDRWVVMEYVTGQSLEEAIQANPEGMASEDAIRWMHGIAAGVAYLHDHGIVHRDLKPGNIFSDEGIVKIGDYGLSKFISCSRRSGQTESVGTVHYMAPEIANGRYGKEIDVYALGILLYEMLTGHVPFEGESVGEVLMKHLTSEPDLSRLASPYLEIVTRAMAKDPTTRFRDAAELAAALPAAEGVPTARLAPPMPVGGEVIQAQVVEVHDPDSRPKSPSSNADDEPIWAWVRQTCSDIGTWWNRQENTAFKVVLLVVGAIVVLSQAGWIVPTAMLLGVCYGAYRVVWTLVNSSTKPPVAPNARQDSTERATRATRAYAAPAKPQPAVNPHARRQKRWHGKPVPARVVRSGRETLMDLTGGMIVGAIVCLVMALSLFLLRGEAAQPEQYGWLSLVSIAGTWLVLFVSRGFELSKLEVPFKRFTMLVVGLLLGLIAYGAQEMLSVQMPHEVQLTSAGVSGVSSSQFASTFFASDGTPQLPAYLAYFGFLFLILRWWRLADSGRGTRISIWAVMVYVFWAFLLCMVWPFPQPWGAMVIATIAVSVQLASPWWHPRRLAAANEI